MRSTTIREGRSLAGRFRGGKLAPVMAFAVKNGEGGMLSQTATIELDPVAGRLITPVTGEMYVVYVPVQAMVNLRDGETIDYAGVTEVIRQRYLDGNPVFDLIGEGEVSQRCGVMPRQIGGVKMVSSAVRLGHICAVNYLRQRVYTYAALLDKDYSSGPTPALLSSTVLSRFNGVLNPDDHVNGMVELRLVQSTAPIDGLALKETETGVTPLKRTSDGAVLDAATAPKFQGAYVAGSAVRPWPTVYANLSGVEAGGFSLTDLANAEIMDRLTREMRDVIDANPVDGEEQVVRWAHGLRVDDAVNPFLLAARTVTFGQDLLKAMDGAGIEQEVTQSRLMQRITVTVPVPTTELGGVVFTFLVVKPDEVLYEQPHPVLADTWAFDNLMAEELQNDPVPVTARDLQATVPQADESKVVMYTGFNELRRAYVNYGWNRHVDPETVDAKNAMWQYEIPASVTPENIIYPELLPQYPFVDQDAEIARYQIVSQFVGKSPIYIGPSPVETVSVIEADDLFGDADQ